MNCGCNKRTRCLPIGTVVKTCPPNTGGDCCNNPVLTAIDSFTMPACGSQIDVTFDCALTVPLDSFIWNNDVGYLQVTLVTVGDSGKVTTLRLFNPCSCGNVSPATVIGAYSTFILAPNTPQGLCSYGPELTDGDIEIDPDSVSVLSSSYYNIGRQIFGQNYISFTSTGAGIYLKCSFPIIPSNFQANQIVGFGQIYVDGVPGTPLMVQVRVNSTLDAFEIRKFDSSSLAAGDYILNFKYDYQSEDIS